MKPTSFLPGLCAFALAVLIAGPTFAGNESLSLRYDVYAGGFKALDAKLEASFARKDYDVTLSAKTQGLMGRLFPWSANYQTIGRAQKAAFIPQKHTVSSRWREDVKQTELTYTQKGEALRAITEETGKEKESRTLPPELSRASVDILTGALMLIRAEKNGACTGSFPIFDGKRRFNIVLSGGEADVIRKTNYSIYSGHALKCFLNVEPVAGFRPRDQKRGWLAVQNHTLARHKPPTIWFARLDENGPAIPVRMEINSDYGAVVAHLAATADAK